MKYVKPNVSDESFIDLITQKIQSKSPLSFTRFGDGEIMILNDKITPHVRNKILKWKHGNFDSTVRLTKDIIESSIKYADVLGFMNPNGLISKKISYKKEVWSVKESYIKSLRSDLPIIADNMITRSKLLGDPKNVSKVFGKTPICIISPRVKELKKNNISSVLGLTVNYVEIPMNINPFDRSDIFMKLDCIQEHIVLYGCAARGKDFGHYLSQRGNIAIDYGATLDAWAGLITRPMFNVGKLQNYCLIDKNNKN